MQPLLNPFGLCLAEESCHFFITQHSIFFSLEIITSITKGELGGTGPQVPSLKDILGVGAGRPHAGVLNALGRGLDLTNVRGC